MDQENIGFCVKREQICEKFDIKHEDIDEIGDDNLENQNLSDVSELNLSEEFLSEILKQVNELCDNIKNGDPDSERTQKVSQNLNDAVNCYRTKLDLKNQITLESQDPKDIDYNKDFLSESNNQSDFDTGDDENIDYVPTKSKRKRNDPDWYVDETINMSYACTHCFKKFPTPSKMEKHKMECTPSDFIKNETVYLKRSKTCSFCSKTFPTPSKLENHERVHTGIKPFSCNLCDKRFTQKCHVKQHMNILHKDNFDARKQKLSKFGVINQCENGSLENGSLENGSLENGSLEDGSLENGLLKNGSLENGSLENDAGPAEPGIHFLTNTKVKPSPSNDLLSYPDFETVRQRCDIEDTDTYQNTMHIPSGEGEEMVNSIMKPSIRNKNKTCSYCLKIFPTPSKLERHVRIHFGIKPFSCNHCDKRFTQEIHLKTHVKISHKDIYDAMRRKNLLSSNHPSTRNKAQTKKRKEIVKRRKNCKKEEKIGKVFETKPFSSEGEPEQGDLDYTP